MTSVVSVLNVFADAVVDENRFLWDESELRAQPRDVRLPYVHSIDSLTKKYTTNVNWRHEHSFMWAPSDNFFYRNLINEYMPSLPAWPIQNYAPNISLTQNFILINYWYSLTNSVISSINSLFVLMCRQTPHKQISIIEIKIEINQQS